MIHRVADPPPAPALAGLLATVLVTTSGCAPLLPSRDRPAVRALVRDVARVVDTRDQVGWTVDDIDVRESLSDAMQSACRVAHQERQLALSWLREQVAAEGGDPGAAYEKAGREIDDIERLWLLHRTELVLAEADRWAVDGKCPFFWYVDAAEPFQGLQGFQERFVITAEAGGRFYTQWEAGNPGFGGGGATRILAGWGLNDRYTLLAGLELGGAGRFTDLELGKRLDVPEVIILLAAPVQLRLHGLSDHVDIEAGPIAYLNQTRTDAQIGGRIGAGMGVSRLAVRGLIPTVTFAINYDFIPAAHSLPEVHQVAGGVRAGIALPF